MITETVGAFRPRARRIWKRLQSDRKMRISLMILVIVATSGVAFGVSAYILSILYRTEQKIREAQFACSGEIQRLFSEQQKARVAAWEEQQRASSSLLKKLRHGTNTPAETKEICRKMKRNNRAHAKAVSKIRDDYFGRCAAAKQKAKEEIAVAQSKCPKFLRRAKR